MFLDATFKKIEKTIASFRNFDVYQIFFDGNREQLLDSVITLQENGVNSAKTNVENIFLKALPMIFNYCFSDEKAEERRLKGQTLETDILLYITRHLNYPCYAMIDGKICVSAVFSSFTAEFSELQHLFEDTLHLQLIVQKANASDCYTMLQQRIDTTRAFYIEERGSWIENFINKLGDDISRISLQTYLRQRVIAQVFDNSPICYPVQPPKETAMWRKKREALTYRLPSLLGVKDPSLFYLCAYIYEQYAIPDVVEALPGDIVIDAGAYIGDTACYFSQKVGDTGKVFSFEIVPESTAQLQRNLYANHCANVEVISYALSGYDGELSLAINANAPSTAFVGDLITREKEKINTVQAVRLDTFCEERNLSVTFIKADIEGSEMAMLHGAKHTIERYAPTCALCVYHKKNDFWEIPDFLHEVRPEYTFWFRCESEPVMFAKVVH